MAKYKREILVPYLRSLCALHLAYRKLSMECDALRSEEFRLEKGETCHKPSLSYPKPLATAGRIISLLAGAFFLIGCIACISSFGTDDTSFPLVGTLLFGALTVAFLWGPISLMRDTKQENDSRYEKYTAALREYERTVTKNKTARQKLPAVRA